MINTIVFALWFFLPAGLANAAPVFANKIPVLNQWNTPLDLGAHFRGKRILGDNKTWRGFLFGIIIALITFALQQYIYTQSTSLQNIISLNYSDLSIWFGALLGLGALGGDAIESFFKRQVGVPSGKPWFPFDQIDYIIGVILVSSLVISLSTAQNAAILIVWFSMHLIWSYIGYLLGFKETPI